MEIRYVSQEDIDTLIELDAEIFGDLRSKLTGRPVQTPLREREFFEFFLRADPHGALIASENDEIVGFTFNHARGRYGWFGPLAVRTSRQSAGVGKLLLERGIEYLQRAGCRVIGLDTFPTNPVSVGMYLRRGFRIVGSTVRLTAPVSEVLRNTTHAGEGGLELKILGTGDVPVISGLEEAVSGFDRTKDLEFLTNWPSATGLAVMRGDTVKGWAFAYLKRGRGVTGLLHVDDDCFEEGCRLLVGKAAEEFEKRGAEEVGALCDGRQVRDLHCLFSMGFLVSTTMVKMLLGEDETLPAHSPLALEKG